MHNIVSGLERAYSRSLNLVVSVVTQDCSSLTNLDIEQMASLSATGYDWGADVISKNSENWVTAVVAKSGNSLQGYILCTLERIGGTPSILIGMACVPKGDQDTLEALRLGLFKKAYMAFPDEDVVVALLTSSRGPLSILNDLEDRHPIKRDRVNGEQRAWGRRLAKRFESQQFEDNSMVATIDSETVLFDYPGEPAEQTAEFLSEFSQTQYCIAWGWALTEYLEEYAS